MDFSRAIIRQDHTGVLIAAGLSGGFCFFTWSFDGGITWATGRQVTADAVADEQPGLVELPDGSLRIAVSQAGAVRLYGSSNGGESWVGVGVLT